MKSIKSFLLFSFAVLALFTSGALAQSSLDREVEHKIRTLTRYNTFDYITWRVDGSTVVLSGDTVSLGTRREADRAVYGPTGALPVDWVARAREALARRKTPPFRPLRLFLPRNLMPFAAALLLLPAALISLRAAVVDAAAAYRKADFAAAEGAWRETVKRTPLDWSARHNLSLALEQQDRAAEAAAHGAVAFIQNPSQPAVRWHFGRTAEKLGAAAPALAGFITPSVARTLARDASPAEWQLRLVVAAWLLAAALAVALLHAYRGGHRGWTWGARALAFAGIVMAAFSVNGLAAYGTAAHPDAAIIARATALRSIPTEADAAQKTTPLAAGGLAVIRSEEHTSELQSH